jgi:hypothetical protein
MNLAARPDFQAVACAELINRACRQTGPDPTLAAHSPETNPFVVEEPVIERAEVVALLFNVSDIAKSLEHIERLLGEDDGEEEDDRS